MITTKTTQSIALMYKFAHQNSVKDTRSAKTVMKELEKLSNEKWLLVGDVQKEIENFENDMCEQIAKFNLDQSGKTKLIMPLLRLRKGLGLLEEEQGQPSEKALPSRPPYGSVVQTTEASGLSSSSPKKLIVTFDSSAYKYLRKVMNVETQVCLYCGNVIDEKNIGGFLGNHQIMCNSISCILKSINKKGDV